MPTAGQMTGSGTASKAGQGGGRPGPGVPAGEGGSAGRPLAAAALASMASMASLASLATVAITSLAALAWPAASAAADARGADVAAALPAIQARIDAIYPDIDKLYRELHAEPELAFQETRTAARLAAEMKALGFAVTEGVGKTGVVAIFRNGAGPTILVRTDLDGLPMEEKTDLPYASRAKAVYNGKETFVAHSCGHDLHMATWVATARTLVDLKDRWRGTLMFVGQPAEELVQGARAMLDDGLFERFGKPDYAFALHTSPMPAGLIGTHPGAMTSNSDSLDITFKGRGGHGSAPHSAIDPVAIAARFVVDVQTIVSREKDPAAFGVITIGAFNAGTAGNIIPDQAVLKGTIRSYDEAVRDKLLAGIRRTATAAALVAGAPEPEVTLTPGGRAIVNDAEVVSRAETPLGLAVGKEKVLRVPPITASEDFSEFLAEGVPGMFFFVGVSDPARIEEAGRPGGRPLPFNHSPFFAPLPEPSIRAGTAAMTAAVLDRLAPN